MRCCLVSLESLIWQGKKDGDSCWVIHPTVCHKDNRDLEPSICICWLPFRIPHPPALPNYPTLWSGKTRHYLFPFYRWGNWGPELKKDLSRVTKSPWLSQPSSSVSWFPALPYSTPNKMYEPDHLQTGHCFWHTNLQGDLHDRGWAPNCLLTEALQPCSCQ